MKVTVVVTVMVFLVGSVAPAPVVSGEQPVQLVVLTKKALEALGVKISENALHSVPIEVEFPGLGGEELPLYSGHTSFGGYGQIHNAPLHHKMRHSRHRFSAKGCHRGWKKDATGKCRRIW